MLQENSRSLVGILDVTLRDGGYANNHDFGIHDIDSVIDGIRDSRIPFIEVGYFVRQGRSSGLPPMACCPLTYLADISQFRAQYARVGGPLVRGGIAPRALGARLRPSIRFVWRSSRMARNASTTS